MRHRHANAVPARAQPHASRRPLHRIARRTADLRPRPWAGNNRRRVDLDTATIVCQQRKGIPTICRHIHKPLEHNPIVLTATPHTWIDPRADPRTRLATPSQIIRDKPSALKVAIAQPSLHRPTRHSLPLRLRNHNRFIRPTRTRTRIHNLQQNPEPSGLIPQRALGISESMLHRASCPARSVTKCPAIVDDLRIPRPSGTGIELNLAMRCDHPS